jgi:hypothetical protein
MNNLDTCFCYFQQGNQPLLVRKCETKKPAFSVVNHAMFFSQPYNNLSKHDNESYD